MKCPHCGAAASVTWDSHDDECGQKVCTECGAVLEENSLQHDPNTVGTVYNSHTASHQYRPNGLERSTLPQAYLDGVRSAYQTYQVPEGKKVALRKIKQLLKFICGQNRQIREECNELFGQVYDQKEFHAAEIPNKEIMAGCCVYIVARTHGIPVTMALLSMLLNCPQHKFGSRLLRVQSALGIKSNVLDLEAFVDTVCSDGGLQNEVNLLVKQMLPLLRDSWIMEGRRITAIIRATSYFAWQSLDFNKRVKTHYPAFMRAHGWAKRITKEERNRYKEIGSVLTKLASAIPWLSPDNIRIKTVAFHLKDILSYQKTIFHELKENDYAGLTGQDSESINLSPNSPRTETAGSSSGEMSTSQEFEVESFSSNGDAVCSGVSVCDQGQKPDNEQQSDLKANGDTAPSPKPPGVKSLKDTNDDLTSPLFLPPSFSLGSKLSEPLLSEEYRPLLSPARLTQMDSEELSDCDVGPEELKQYIRTPQEILRVNLLNSLNE